MRKIYYKMAGMKTTIDIPEQVLTDAMRFMNANSKREAVVTALQEFNRRCRMARLARFSGTCEFVDNATLEAAEMDEVGTVRE